MIKIGFWDVIISIIVFFWTLFVSWLLIFIAPLKNLEMLWIIIPIYMNWIFTDIYQEKKKTSLGNAISNGVVILWVGLDWIRHLVRLINAREIFFGPDLIMKFGLSTIAILFGLFIVINGIRAKHYISYLGRIRETSYVMIMFSPIIYGIIDISWQTALSMVLFFPLFYYGVEYIMKVTPHPAAYGEEKPKEGMQDSMDRPLESNIPPMLPPTGGI